MRSTFIPRSEFSALPTPFERFAKSPQWASLPFAIRLALLHVRRAEQAHTPSIDECCATRNDAAIGSRTAIHSPRT
jgi:hypothetical protein